VITGLKSEISWTDTKNIKLHYFTQVAEKYTEPLARKEEKRPMIE
jgi:hypothetical protein